MGFIIFIILVVIGVNVLRAVLNEKKRGTMDENGTVRCSRCGCTTFAYKEGKYGETITTCVNCGQTWKTV